MSKNTKIALIVVAVLLVLLIAAECDAENRNKYSDPAGTTVTETTAEIPDVTEPETTAGSDTTVESETNSNPTESNAPAESNDAET